LKGGDGKGTRLCTNLIRLPKLIKRYISNLERRADIRGIQHQDIPRRDLLRDLLRRRFIRDRGDEYIDLDGCIRRADQAFRLAQCRLRSSGECDVFRSSLRVRDCGRAANATPLCLSVAIHRHVTCVYGKETMGKTHGTGNHHTPPLMTQLRTRRINRRVCVAVPLGGQRGKGRLHDFTVRVLML